tara:strand:- start:1670 stop:3445 length:1776 start_codon:yes stop_codon:yes gene_type:complete
MLYRRPIISLPFLGFDLKIILTAGLLLYFQATVAQLVEDDAIMGVLTDHTGGYLGTGVSFADFNGDGKDDLSFGHHEGDLRFYVSTDGGFEELDLGLTTPEVQSKGLLWADIDNDGDQDLFAAFRLAPNKLWINEGDMNMVDVSETCGIAQDNRRSFGPAFGDFDRDGQIDLFVSNYGYGVDIPQGNELYRNLGDGTFEEVSDELGMGGANLQSFQAQWVDVDRDGWLDLNVIRDRFIYPNLFYMNNGSSGEVTFTESAESMGLDVAINCMSTCAHDYDRDGDIDFFLSGGLEGNVFLQNDGSGNFTDITTESLAMNEICWAGQWIDVDSDGWEELHVATSIAVYVDYPAILYQFNEEPDALFTNNEGTLEETGTFFQSVTSLGYSTAIGDYNDDGFVDLVSHHIGPIPEFRTSTPNENNWLKVRLEGTESNRDAIGSKIEIWRGGNYWYRETYCGEGYLSQNSRWEHFGLGSATAVDSVTIHWPNGLVETWQEIEANQNLLLTEGTAPCEDSCSGCTYVNACNYNILATIDDGTCDFSCFFDEFICGQGSIWNANTAQCEVSCLGDLNNNGTIDVDDLLVFLSVFASVCP